MRSENINIKISRLSRDNQKRLNRSRDQKLLNIKNQDYLKNEGGG